MASSVQSVGLFEKDVNGDVLLGWCFPALDKKLKEVAQARSGLGEEADQNTVSASGTALDPAFRFSKFKHTWLYQFAVPVKTPKNPKLTAVSFYIAAMNFNPAKYCALLQCLSAEYLEDGECSAVRLLAAYLSFVTNGGIKATASHEAFDSQAFDDRRALVWPLKDLFEIFGIESVLIWHAMLLRKRIFVYSSKLADLLQFVRAFPLLGAWHRLDFDILRPHVTLSETELDDIRGAGVYVAGFTDSTASSRRDLYDLFVDIGAKTIAVNDQAKADFTLSKFHKDIAQYFVSLAGEESDQGMIKAVAAKTKELVSNVASLRTEHADGTYVTLEELQEKKLPPNMDRFLFNVALAERLTKH